MFHGVPVVEDLNEQHPDNIQIAWGGGWILPYWDRKIDPINNPGGDPMDLPSDLEGAVVQEIENRLARPNRWLQREKTPGGTDVQYDVRLNEEFSTDTLPVFLSYRHAQGGLRRTYESRFEESHGPLPPQAEKVLEKLLRCGDPRYGLTLLGGVGRRRELCAGSAHPRWSGRTLDQVFQERVTISVWGTPEYIAPDQLDGGHGEVDAVSDLFSVAAILYEALTGVGATKKAPLPSHLRGAAPRR